MPITLDCPFAGDLRVAAAEEEEEEAEEEEEEEPSKDILKAFESLLYILGGRQK